MMTGSSSAFFLSSVLSRYTVFSVVSYDIFPSFSYNVLSSSILLLTAYICVSTNVPISAYVSVVYMVSVSSVFYCLQRL